jgi:hypothetical protein
MDCSYAQLRGREAAELNAFFRATRRLDPWQGELVLRRAGQLNRSYAQLRAGVVGDAAPDSCGYVLLGSPGDTACPQGDVWLATIAPGNVLSSDALSTFALSQ